MKDKFNRIIILKVALMLFLMFIINNKTASAQPGLMQRLSGEDRYKTAVAISQSSWKASEYVVLVRGDDFADALCAGPLAKKYNAPILLTESNSLNSDTLYEIKRLGSKHIVIVGGTGAVSTNVENALKLQGINDIDRIYGNDRYDTSIKVAEKLGYLSKIIIATGNDFPDALSISAVAAKTGIPILLTEKNNLPYKVKEFIKGRNIEKSYLIGGTGVISDNVKNLVPNSMRLSGNNRYETNAIVIQEFSGELNFDRIYLAVGEGPNGNEFADALTGAVLAAKTSSPMVLVNKSLPYAAENLLKSKLSLGSKITALGGEGAVPSAVGVSANSIKDKISIKYRYDKAGTYGPSTGTLTAGGNVVINVPDVTLQNINIEGDLLLGDGIGKGNVNLNNVTVRGRTYINGGGPNSVIMYNFNGQTVVVDVPDGNNVRLVAEGTTSISSVIMNSAGKLEENALVGNGFTTVEIPAGAQVSLAGSFGTVNVGASGANINIDSGTISNLNILNTASNVFVGIRAGASVTTFDASAPATVFGEGIISTANIRSGGVSISQRPGFVYIEQGRSATVSGNMVSSGNTYSSGGTGGGYSGSSGGDSGNNSNNNQPTPDSTPPTSSVTTALIKVGDSVTTAQSTETGTIYLVLDSANITTKAQADEAAINCTAKKVDVSQANSNITIPATGLSPGIYKVVAADTAGNLSQESTGTITIQITDAFEKGSPIPDKYASVNGLNKSIPLSWNKPEGTLSFAIDMRSDISVYNWKAILPANVTSIGEGANSSIDLGCGANQINQYQGPGSIADPGNHVYTIKVYALNVEGNTITDEASFNEAISNAGHVISNETISGTYMGGLRILDTRVTSKGTHYSIVSGDSSHTTKSDNTITSNSTLITTTTTVSELLNNLQRSDNTEWGVLTSQNEPITYSDFYLKQKKNASDYLKANDVLAVVAAGGIDVRVYAINVIGPAHEISSTASPGIQIGSTKVTASAGQGNHLVIKVSSSTITTPNIGDAVPEGYGVVNPYTSGADITGVDVTTNKYVTVYEANSNNEIVKFKLITLNSSMIQTEIAQIGLEHWYTRTSGVGVDLHGAAYGKNVFVAVGDYGTIISSPDGLSWTKRYENTENLKNKHLYDVIFNGDKFVAVGNDGAVITSSDGVSWQEKNSGTNCWFRGIAYGPVNGVNTFIAVGDDGAIITSQDAEIWTWRGISSSNNIYGRYFGVAFGDGKFVISELQGKILVSSDGGANWSNTSSQNSYLYKIGYFNNTFISVGYDNHNNGTMFTSTDGDSWVQLSSQTSNSLRSITYGNNTFAAVGFNCTVLTSQGGQIWTVRSYPTMITLYGAAFGNNTLLVVGTGGNILQSDTIQ